MSKSLNLVNLERYVRRVVAGYGDYIQDDEDYIQERIKDILRDAQRPHKHKELFWLVRGNWLQPRLIRELNDPDADMRIVGFFRSKAGAFKAVEESLNSYRRDTPPVILEWHEVDPALVNRYRAEWSELCDDKTSVMRCSAEIYTEFVDYLETY